ncbi:hypothetical protein FDV58_18070 [Bradyrhizobium elkanii]|uniref:Uncharacterized protein n=1 Tax=Bradyrhizobium elkanii TaxID=29448 RepID=A0A4U6RZF0_BRAEL|nr:hypothetical protein [Bradyrhizobium elkanii]TKV80150.1 hypothetical protein FDV58_18070 [Bradyrhizobium elkanii]
MANNEIAYEIDDRKTVDQNLSALSAALKQIDDPLADVLEGVLSQLSLEIAPDQDALLDALYAATAPVEPQQTSSEEGSV